MKSFKEVTGMTYRDWGKTYNLTKDRVCRAWQRGHSILRPGGTNSHPLYITYKDMIRRCYNKNDSDYKYYGARGITVCARWFYSFDNFVKDMGPRPESYSLDRINCDEGYGPNNCRWASNTLQVINRRGSLLEGIQRRESGRYRVRVTIAGVRISRTFNTLPEAAEYRDNLFRYRINNI